MEWAKPVILLLSFASVALFVWAALRQVAWSAAHDKPTELELLRRSGRRSPFDGDVTGPLLLPFLLLARALPTPRFRDRLAELLVRAGNPNFHSPDEQLAICCAAAVGMAVVGAVLGFLNDQRLNMIVLIGGSVGLLAGFYGPVFLLASDGRRRLRSIGKSLPYALDLISLTMGAGATFAEAVRTMIKGRTGDALTDEFQRLLAEIEFGTSRSAALANMAARIPLDDFRNVVAGINQAETYGSSLTETLKAQAALMRLKRSVAAEKAAAEASIRMLLPMTLILVAVMVLVFAPAVVHWKTDKLF
jgi:tight adherence protein C